MEPELHVMRRPLGAVGVTRFLKTWIGNQIASSECRGKIGERGCALTISQRPLYPTVPVHLRCAGGNECLGMVVRERCTNVITTDLC